MRACSVVIFTLRTVSNVWKLKLPVGLAFDTCNRVFEIVTEKSTTDIKCNTEKDKSRINHKTAGILLDAWPCGTIAMLGELFGAESKTQIYGQLHTLVARNVESTSHLGLPIMAGLGVISESLYDGKWYRCSDGWPLEPIDVLHLMFPNKGRNSTGRNVCFVPRLIDFPPLLNLLPNPTELFVPNHLVDCCIILFALCILVTFGLVLSKFIWEKLDLRFASISPTHKKWYVVANMSKSFFLACMALSSRYWIGAYLGFFLDEFQTVELKRCCMLYIVTDVVALYMVPKLPRSTVLHHVSTATLIMLVSAMDISVKGWGGLLGVCKMALIYGVFSSFAFLVNAYLALRVVYPKAKWMPLFVKFSLYPYVLCCAINWTVHLVWLAGIITAFNFSVYNVLYMSTISFMIHDDIVLIRWLIKRSSPMAANEEGNKTE